MATLRRQLTTPSNRSVAIQGKRSVATQSRQLSKSVAGRQEDGKKLAARSQEPSIRALKQELLTGIGLGPLAPSRFERWETILKNTKVAEYLPEVPSGVTRILIEEMAVEETKVADMVETNALRDKSVNRST